MTAFDIVQIGHPTLRARAQEVTADETHRSYEGCLSIPERVEDPTTLCTWEMFRRFRQDAWLASVAPLLERFPGEEPK